MYSVNLYKNDIKCSNIIQQNNTHYSLLSLTHKLHLLMTGAPDPGTPDPCIPRLPVIGLSSPLISDLGFCTVSSIDNTRHAASEAAVIALIRTMAGSQTKASKLSEISSFMTSTPNHVPSAACF